MFSTLREALAAAKGRLVEDASEDEEEEEEDQVMFEEEEPIVWVTEEQEELEEHKLELQASLPGLYSEDGDPIKDPLEQIATQQSAAGNEDDVKNSNGDVIKSGGSTAQSSNTNNYWVHKPAIIPHFKRRKKSPPAKKLSTKAINLDSLLARMGDKFQAETNKGPQHWSKFRPIRQPSSDCSPHTVPCEDSGGLQKDTIEISIIEETSPTRKRPVRKCVEKQKSKR